MKKIYILIVLFTSCQSAPDGFCDCMKAGEELNALSQKVLKGGASNALKEKMMASRKKKKAICAKFETSSGKQMLEWQKACK